MKGFEKLGAFYLGAPFDLESEQRAPHPLLLDSRKLTTHALCIGMTGSGKTGLCLSLLEEAAIDGVPVIAIDPKGDLGNLLLTFPKLTGEAFSPWVDPAQAGREGLDPDALAEREAERWREGLADWGQDESRIQTLRDTVDLAIYTPGSEAGLGLSVLDSLKAPPPELQQDGELLRERISSTVSGLLALLGIDADPVKSREHILLCKIMEHAYAEGRDLDLKSLIQAVQRPPMRQVGVLDLEVFFPEKDRFALLMQLNNLIAAPSFAGFLAGEPLDAQSLLFTPQGKPRVSILSIAHLNDAERMFFVTLLLNEIVSFTRRQTGTSSLRAIVYMDEIYGYFPPVASPPSKQPMLRLLKQARAFGVGVVLATQNPVDLDYRGLSNIGTWLVGRLGTEQDRSRVLDAFELGDAERKASDAALAKLPSRVFLLHQAGKQHITFATRWALSYLRGPLTRAEIKRLMAPKRTARPAASAAPEAAQSPDELADQLPAIPSSVPHFYAPPAHDGESAYRACVLVLASLAYVHKGHGVDHVRDIALTARVGDGPIELDLAETAELSCKPDALLREPPARARFLPVPQAALRSKSYPRWEKQAKIHLARHLRLQLWREPRTKLVSRPGESESAFRARVAQHLREERDAQVETLGEKHAAALERLDAKVARAQAKLTREQAQATQAKWDGALSIGKAVLGAFLGRGIATSANVGRATSAAKSVGRASREATDVAGAEKALADLSAKREAMASKLSADLEALKEATGEASLEAIALKATRANVQIKQLALLFLPVETNASVG